MNMEGVKNLSSMEESALERLESEYYSQRHTCGRGSNDLQLGVCRHRYDGAGPLKPLLVHPGTHILGEE